MQRIPGQHLTGSLIRLQGRLRTRNVIGGASLWLRIDGEKRMLFFDNMTNRSLKGDREWTDCEIITQVPSGGEWINYGILFIGSGVVWADDLKLSVQDTRLGRWRQLMLWLDSDRYIASFDQRT